MAIQTSDISSDEDVARRVLVHARSIAPCLDTLSGTAELDAIAVLKGIVAELPAAGSARVKSMSRNGTSITFDLASAFTPLVEASLRSLCATGTLPGAPLGSFPTVSPLAVLYPEGDYS